MYEAYYGLTSKPFQLAPDPLFYFGSKQHQRAKAYLEYGLHQSEGFIVITGEVGAGKTTILRGLIDQLDPTHVIAANVVSTQLQANDILRMVCAAFGAEVKDASKAALLIALEAKLQEHCRAGRRCLLIIDEAQHLSFEALEELRMLSNFQSGTHALLQSFLVGQPEFRDIVYSPRMQQLQQRIIASCHIGPMDEAETRGYVAHRLTCAGAKDKPVFRDDAFRAIFRASGGIPRRINLICDRVLLSGLLNDQHVFSAADVAEVVSEIQIETSPQVAPAGSPSSTPLASLPSSSAAELPSGMALFGRTANVGEGAEVSVSNGEVSQRLDRLEGLVGRIEASHDAALELLRNLTIARLGLSQTRKGGK